MIEKRVSLPSKKKTPQLAKPDLVKPAEPAVNEMQLWKPEPELVNLTRELAELGWTVEGIATEIAVPYETFLSSADLVNAFNAGQSTLKALPTKRMNWRPTPNDISTVKFYARKGLTEIGVAAKMQIPREIFLMRMHDTVQMRDAFMQGNGEFHALKIEEFNTLMDDKSPALKYLTTPYIFTLKSGGMKDGSERAEKTIEVNHTHTHKLKTPEPVAVKDVSNFVQLEMARAQKISAKKMSEVSILSGDIVEAEVAD